MYIEITDFNNLKVAAVLITDALVQASDWLDPYR